MSLFHTHALRLTRRLAINEAIRVGRKMKAKPLSKTPTLSKRLGAIASSLSSSDQTLMAQAIKNLKFKSHPPKGAAK